MSTQSEKTIAQAMQEACIQAAREGFQDASIQGLCHEGAIEVAISAMQMVKADDIIARQKDSGAH